MYRKQNISIRFKLKVKRTASSESHSPGQEKCARMVQQYCLEPGVGLRELYTGLELKQ